MSIALTATFEVQADKTAEFEAVVLELAGKVLGGEPGVSMYQLCRSQIEPTKYRLLEVYDGQETLTAHGQTAWFKELGPKLGACLAAKPVIEKFDFVTG